MIHHQHATENNTTNGNRSPVERRPLTGRGPHPAGFPSLAGQHAEYIAAQLTAYRKGYEDDSGRTNDGDIRIMRMNAFGLSDREIQAVSSYAAGLH